MEAHSPLTAETSPGPQDPGEPPLSGERLLPLGRSLGMHGGVVWLREAWRVYRQAKLAAIALALGALFLILLAVAGPLTAALALLACPFLLAASALVAQADRRGAAPRWRVISGALSQRAASLSKLGLLGLALSLALLMAVRLAEPLTHEETLGHLIAQGLAGLVLLSAMIYSPFLMLEHGLSPTRALLASAAGTWRNLLGAVELVIGFIFLCVVLCTPVVLVLVFASPDVTPRFATAISALAAPNGNMRFAATVWLPVGAGLLLLPALVLSPYFAYRDIFIEEPPPAELSPLRL